MHFYKIQIAFSNLHGEYGTGTFIRHEGSSKMIRKFTQRISYAPYNNPFLYFFVFSWNCPSFL
jgi:hypothetical protein